MKPLRAFLESFPGSDGMVLSADETLLEWGDVRGRRGVHSIRKSFLGALIGIHVDLGTIDLAATLEDLGIDDRESLTAIEKTATVGDLLTARSGVYHPADGESPWMASIRPPRGSHAPGTRFVYNNWDFNTLGSIFERATGRNLFEEFRDRLARPIGMQDFRYESGGGDESDGVHWEPRQSVHRMFAFRLSLRDLARFGQLYLHEGRWGDEPVVPSAWVRASVEPRADAGTSGAYGYLWWVARDGELFRGTKAPSGTYAALGFGGQALVVVPERGVVIVYRPRPIEGHHEAREHLGLLLDHVLDSR